MKNSGLTERKMANKKFRTTEEAIFLAYCKLRDYPSTKQLSRHAKVSRATFYRHHRKVITIPDDYEKYLLESYHRTIHGLLRKSDTTLRALYFRVLAFMMNNRDIFVVLFREGRKEIIKKMLDSLEKRVRCEWQIGGDLSKMFNVYKNEVLGAIEVWAKNGFIEKDLDITLYDIMYLTRTARQRLLPLK